MDQLGDVFSKTEIYLIRSRRCGFERRQSEGSVSWFFYQPLFLIMDYYIKGDIFSFDHWATGQSLFLKTWAPLLVLFQSALTQLFISNRSMHVEMWNMTSFCFVSTNNGWFVSYFMVCFGSERKGRLGTGEWRLEAGGHGAVCIAVA